MSIQQSYRPYQHNRHNQSAALQRVLLGMAGFSGYLVLLGAALPAQAQITVSPAPIVNRLSGKCVNVYGEFTQAGTQTIQWPCGGERSSSFTLKVASVPGTFLLQALHSGMNIGVASTAAGAQVVQGVNTLWILDTAFPGSYRLRAQHSNLCLQVQGATDNAGALLIQSTCGANDSDLWSFGTGFVPAEWPLRMVSAIAPNRCASIAYSSNQPGAAVVAFDCAANTQGAAQPHSYKFQNIGAGAYRVTANQSGLCLGLSGTSVIQATCGTGLDQKWYVNNKISGSPDQIELQNAATLTCANFQGGAQNANIILASCTTTTVQSRTIRLTTADKLGAWSKVISMPLVPVSAALLNNGKVMTWAAWQTHKWGDGGGQTQTALFDPVSATPSAVVQSNTGHDMFCSGTVMLPNGNVFVSGGVNAERTSIYSVAGNSWYAAPQLKIARGYNGAVTLASGNVFTIGGSWSGGFGGKTGEVFNESTGWSVRTGIPEDPIVGPDPQGIFLGDNHPWLFTLPSGVFHAGPSANMNWLRPDSNTSAPAGLRADDGFSMNGNAVMYDAVNARILKVGGAAAYENVNATGNAYVINLSSGAPVTSKTGSLNFERTMMNSVVLPNGQVFTVGGQKVGRAFFDPASRLVPEIWSAASGRFEMLMPMTVPRNYHSIALLLPDARVLVGGGGLCGPGCVNNHANVEIYSPGYLFQPNGLAALRPVITAAPATMAYAVSATVSTGAAVSSFAMVRTSSVSHSLNNDQRRVPLTVKAVSGTTYTVATPAGAGVAPPGYYMLFAINAQGVPSLAKMVQVK